MATCGSVEGGVSTQGGVVHSHGVEPQSAGEVAGWSRGRYGPLCCSNASSFSYSSPFVPRCVVATSPVPIASFVAHLPVWPSHPPPSIVCTSRCVGAKRFALESATARVCREASGRVTTNVMVRDLDLGDPRAADARRLEVVVDGLPLFGGCQLAVDATVVSALHFDGSPHRGAENLGGMVLHGARRRQERTYTELVGPRRRARLVVLGIEVGGRVSTEKASFLSQLAKTRARQETALMRRRAEQAWRMRWGAQSPHLCSVCAHRMARMVTHLQRMRWKGTIGMLVWSREVL